MVYEHDVWDGSDMPTRSIIKCFNISVTMRPYQIEYCYNYGIIAMQHTLSA